jgi:outer membrane immunogenic protein
MSVDYEEAFMRRHLLAVFVACLSIAGATGAALSDGAPSYDYAPAYTPTPQGWRGFYLGAHLGGTWGSSEANDASGTTTLNDSWSASPSGVVAGGTLGYNWQLGPMIYGVEGDLGYLGLAGSGGYYVPFGYDASTSTDADFYLTLRGRLGVLANGWLIYFTGGYLGADTTVSVLAAGRSAAASRHLWRAPGPRSSSIFTTTSARFR